MRSEDSLVRLAKHACRRVRSRGGRPIEAAWSQVYLDLSGRNQRRVESGPKLFSYALLKAKEYYWEESQSALRQTRNEED